MIQSAKKNDEVGLKPTPKRESGVKKKSPGILKKSLGKKKAWVLTTFLTFISLKSPNDKEPLGSEFGVL